MKMPEHINPDMIAYCGVNCLACGAHLDAKKPCPGCRAPKERYTRKSCMSCAKKDCAQQKGFHWCFECGAFPCAKIKSLNKNYVKNYGVDLAQNGRDAMEDMPAFLAAQKEQFTCRECGGVIDQHKKRCSECGREMQ